MSHDVNCPYCGKGQEICHDDGYGYVEDEVFSQECGDCGKTFVYTTSIHYYYEANKADCLNGSEHTFKPTHTYPRYYTRMRCADCDAQRQMTPEEKKLHDIPERP